MKHDFRYFFREGIRNMFSHGFMSFAAIGVTVACLVIMGTFSLVAYNANENLKDLQKDSDNTNDAEADPFDGEFFHSMGRRFRVTEHPRLAQLLAAGQAMRFETAHFPTPTTA